LDPASAFKELKNAEMNTKKTLLVLGNGEAKFAKYFRNIDQVKVVNSQGLNTYLVIGGQRLLFTENALVETLK